MQNLAEIAVGRQEVIVMEKLLILYSNPEDTHRIRLDKEHRAIDRALASSGVPPYTVVRKHAVTFGDLTEAVAAGEFSVFHFSGHGRHDGICLESDCGGPCELIGPERIAALLLKAQPRLKLAVFMSCFSSDAIPALSAIAPYLLTVAGPADDSHAIEFVSNFYSHFLRSGSISKACFFAEQESGTELHVVLSRRPDGIGEGRVLFEVFPRGDHFGDSFLVDLTAAQKDIETLDVPKDVFLQVLTRKIRLHHRIFDAARERAVLPVGPYVGLFSWKNAKDYIICHRILKFKSGIEQSASDTWARLAVRYNDRVILPYRLQDQPAAAHGGGFLRSAVECFKNDYESLCDRELYLNVLQKTVPHQYMLCRSTMNANLAMATQKLQEEDYVSTVFHLESVLSALHDLLDAFTGVITDAPQVQNE